MPGMTNPHDALVSMQQALLDGKIDLMPGRVDPGLHLHFDMLPDGSPRFTYVRLKNQTITAFCAFVQADPYEGSPCFQVGYAVPERFRNLGNARSVVAAAIAEMQNGFANQPPFYVEALIGLENVASQRVAAAVLAVEPSEETDSVSGLRALYYIQKFETKKR